MNRAITGSPVPIDAKPEAPGLEPSHIVGKPIRDLQHPYAGRRFAVKRDAKLLFPHSEAILLG